MLFRPTTAVALALALAVSCAKRAPPTSAPIDAASVVVTPAPLLPSDEAVDPIPFDPLAKALTKGVRDLDAACAADDAPACAKLGVWLLEGERLPENARSAAARFQRGWERGHVHSCALLESSTRSALAWRRARRTGSTSSSARAMTETGTLALASPKSTGRASVFPWIPRAPGRTWSAA